MPTIATNTDTLTYTAPEPVVAVAASLLDEFVDVDYLYLDRLDRQKAPAIEEALFEYRVGPNQRMDGARDQYDPQDLNNKFVRVTIPATVTGDDDIVWYGIIEVEEREVYGSQTEINSIGFLVDQPAGVQHITAYGLIRLLERKQVTQSVVAQSSGTLTIFRAVPFNEDSAGEYYNRGNKDSSSAVFSRYPRNGNVWGADDAVTYTLAQDATTLTKSGSTILWLLDDPDSALDWATPTVRRQDRSIKDILDDLIPRQRGLTYHVEFDADLQTIFVTVDSFSAFALSLPSGDTLPQNRNLYSLNFEEAFDIRNATIRTLATQEFDRIICQGAWRTTTFTITAHLASAGDDYLEPDWTSTEETAYKDGFSNDGGYAALDLHDKYQKNRITRQSDQFRNVYTRWTLSSDFNGRIAANLFGGDLNEYFLVPPLNSSGNPVQPWALTTNEDPEFNIWVEGARFLPKIALRERLDYSGTKISGGTFPDTAFLAREDYRPPLVFLVTDTINGTAHVEQVEKLAHDSEQTGRRWNCSVRIPQLSPTIEVRATPAQHLLAKTDWTTGGAAAATEDSRDPTAGGNGLDWQSRKLRATLTMQLDRRLQVERIRPASTGGGGIGGDGGSVFVEALDAATAAAASSVGSVGQAERVKVINLPFLRLDYVVPYTVVAIEDGQQVFSTSGGYVRDDRQTLRDFCFAAELWYGQTRQAVEFTYKQVRNLFELGWLITSYGNHQKEDVNTMITGITYDFTGTVPTTTVKTSFSDFDFEAITI